MGEDVYYHQGEEVPRPRIFRVARLHAKPGRDIEVMQGAERAARSLRLEHAEVPFRSYLARSYGPDGCCEVLVVMAWDRPSDMRQVILSAEAATQPFEVAGFVEAIDGCELTTYEVYYPRPEEDA